MDGYLGMIQHALSGSEALSDYSKSLSCNLARTARLLPLNCLSVLL